jgi:ABC-type dipeptide/oligopeptide/nickel transport system permease subunit
MSQSVAPRSARLSPLLLGGGIVLGLVLVALFGPALAPKDPLARTLVTEIGGRTVGVPFPPFQTLEFPLGSDRFGRDLWSRLLWAVRPTLLLALIVAGVRLGFGVLLGAVAGWSARLPGRALSALIDAALAIPVLVVALAAIAAVGIELGLPAFIVGMALTGWAETAQIVRAETQLVAGRPYIQAARALGANGPQIMLRHVARHLAPLLAMLLAFEVSAVLLLTGALGFLGYFIGGGVWIIVAGEYVPIAERVAGLPELGQLIGAAPRRFSSRPPWEMIFPGVVLVVAILGFSLLGEGLRRRQGRVAVGGSWLTRLLRFAGAHLEEVAVTRAGAIDGRVLAGVAAAALVVLLGVGGLRLLGGPAQMPAASAPASSALAPLNGWVADRGDPYGTLRTPAALVTPTVSWEFSDPAGLSGGPVVAADGTLYVAGSGGRLHALGPDGAERWSADLEAEPVGAPALGPDGSVYVADRSGGLSAFSAAGEARWRFQSAYRPEATGGPVVAPDGTIFYTVIDGVQAVAPDGVGRWVGVSDELSYQEQAPRLSPDGAMVFLEDATFNSADGALLAFAVVPEQPRFAEPAMLVGGDGRTYYRTEHRLVPWRRVEAGVAVQPALSWPAANVLILPSDVGVTAAGTAWMLYSTDFADTRLVWIDSQGQQLGETSAPLRSGRAIGVADDGTMQLCGSARNRQLRCAAFNPAAGDEPLWELDLGDLGALARGGAAVGERLYVVTDSGRLFAIE